MRKATMMTPERDEVMAYDSLGIPFISAIGG
jgi:hypothetical protein